MTILSDTLYACGSCSVPVPEVTNTESHGFAQTVGLFEEVLTAATIKDVSRHWLSDSKPFVLGKHTPIKMMLMNIG